MPAALTPSDIARQTFKLLAERRLPPTPEHYTAVYDEIAGVAMPSVFPQAALRHISALLPAQNATQKRLLNDLGQAIDHKDWMALQAVLVGYANLSLKAPLAPQVALRSEELPVQILPADLAEALARLLNNSLPAFSDADPRLLNLSEELSRYLRSGKPSAAEVHTLLGNLAHRVSFSAEEHAAIHQSLLALLQLSFDHIASLSMPDEWAQAQVSSLRQATTPPLHLQQLTQVQRDLKDIIFAQTEARQRWQDAQSQMKEMLSTFVRRLSQITHSSDQYRVQMEHMSQAMSQTPDLPTIDPLLENVVSATRAMATSSRMAHDELQELRKRAQQKQDEITQLRRALDEASHLSRHDALTGALNRKGLNEALEREVARARREETPLCVAVLQIDAFDALRQDRGGATAEAALAQLAHTAVHTFRPQDALARYGDQEFAVVLPNTSLAQGAQAITRLQRAWAQALAAQALLPKTLQLGAGLAPIHETDSAPEALLRADQRLQQALASGPGQVITT